MARSPSTSEVELLPLVQELLSRRGYHSLASPGPDKWDLVARKGPEFLGVEVTRSVRQFMSRLEQWTTSKRMTGVLVVTTTPVSKSMESNAMGWARDHQLGLEILDEQSLRALLDQPSKPGRARIRRIQLDNVRGFRDFTLDLDAHDGNAILIGRNGTGKSTLLRAIGLVLAAPADAQALLARPIGSFVREGARTARIEADLVDAGSESPRRVSMTIEADSQRLVIVDESGPSTGCFVCGYGIGRSATGGSQPATYRTRDAIASLFEAQSTLADPELVLRRLQDHIGTKRYAAAMTGIRRLLGLGRGHAIDIARGGGIRVSGRGIGKDIPLEGWADGYRMTFQWLVDFHGWALQADVITSKGGIQGVLLIDELEQHLHPAMQAGLLPHLRKLLPDTQIIASTHSPLVALGAPRDIVALHRRGGKVEQVPVPDLSGYSAQDVLIEDALFGTDPYAPATRKKLDEQMRLASISKSKRSAKQRQRLARLAAELGPANKPELRDDPVLAELRQLQDLLTKQVAE